jgi:hypothetical protein
MLNRIFLAHPASVNESSGEHLVMASGFGFRLLLAACVCLIHAVMPCFFTKTASKMINELHARMVIHRAQDKL